MVRRYVKNSAVECELRRSEHVVMRFTFPAVPFLSSVMTVILMTAYAGTEPTPDVMLSMEIHHPPGRL